MSLLIRFEIDFNDDYLEIGMLSGDGGFIKFDKYDQYVKLTDEEYAAAEKHYLKHQSEIDYKIWKKFEI